MLIFTCSIIYRMFWTSIYRTVCYNADLRLFLHYTGCSELSCIELSVTMLIFTCSIIYRMFWTVMYRNVCYNADLRLFLHYTECSELSCIELSVTMLIFTCSIIYRMFWTSMYRTVCYNADLHLFHHIQNVLNCLLQCWSSLVPSYTGCSELSCIEMSVTMLIFACSFIIQDVLNCHV